MDVPTIFSSVYFVACTLAGVCQENRVVDFVEANKSATQVCQEFKRIRPVAKEFTQEALAEGYRVELRCGANTTATIKPADAAVVSYVTACRDKQECTTEKVAQYNTPTDEQDMDTVLNDCEQDAAVLAQERVNVLRGKGYTKFTYACFPTTEVQ